jgi:hypothetical protein
MPCGVYFFRLDAAGFRSLNKTVVTRQQEEQIVNREQGADRTATGAGARPPLPSRTITAIDRNQGRAYHD